MSTLLATGVGTALVLGTGVAIAQSGDDDTDYRREDHRMGEPAVGL